MAGPIRPDEVAEVKIATIPEIVFDTFNELIAANFSNGCARVKQNDVINRLVSKDMALSKSHVFENGWLNVEEAYREKGWKVSYDKPGYNESYEAFFEFRAK